MNQLPNVTHLSWTRLWSPLRWSLLVVLCGGIFGPTAAWAASDFVVLGEEGIWVREGSTVVSGDVGANVASAGPWLASDQEVTFGNTVIVQDPTSRVMGDTIRLKSGTQVHDVFVNTLRGPGIIQGTITTPVTLPLVATLPPVPPVTPGTQDFDVASGGTLSLDAGQYGLLKARNGAVITLTGGVYHFQTWDLRANAQVLAAAPVNIRVQDHLETRNRVVVGPAPTATTLTAGDVVIVGTGINGTTGAIDAIPEAVRVGTDSTIRANIYAPNGLIRIRENSIATGAFVGKWVRMGNGGTITLEGGFGLGPGGSNTPPVADAGPDQTVQVTDIVQLDGSDSTDVDGDLLTYTWMILTQPPGSTTTLDDATSVMPTFVADVSGSYEIQLIVNDGSVDSAPDTVTITTINSPPVANAGPDQTVLVTQNVLLDGTNSLDVDQDPLTFQWNFISVPSSSTTSLSDPTSPTPEFTVDLPGTYEVQLVVNDGTEDSAPDTVVINTQNSKPVANAGQEQTVPIGSTVQLDGSNSSDVDGDPLTFLWALIAMPTNSTAVLSDTTLVNPTFVADLPGIYVVQLIVNDGNEDSDPATVTILTANTPPVAEAGPDQSVPVGTTVQLDGSASSDVEGSPLTFLWTLTSQPSGSTASLSDVTLVNPTLTVDVVGSYVVSLVVNDGTDNSLPNAVLVTAQNTRPVANAGLDQTVIPGETVQLDGSGSSDPESDPLTYQWTLLSRPVSSAAALSDATLSNPTFVADLDGTYLVELIVNDGTDHSVADSVSITATNPAPTLNPIGNQSVVLGQTLLLTLSGSDPNSDPLSFGATTIPLPANMTLNGTTGALVFHPDETQVGAHVLTFFVSDGQSTAEETITITVQGPSPGGSTGIQGRILDTNAFVSGGTEVPVVGATVTFLGTGVSVASDSQGFFTLSGLPAGTQVLDIDASTAQAGPGGVTYASFREQLTLLANVTNVHERPFFLPNLDPNSAMTVNGLPVTQVDPDNTTVVSNPVLGITLTIPANTAKNADGTNYTGPLTISDVPDALAPAALPDTLDPGLLITVQPPGVLFTTPAAITFPNVDQGLPGDQVDLWSLDPVTGLFRIVGQLEVSAGGTTYETVSGGVIATDWFCPCPPAAGGGPTGGLFPGLAPGGIGGEGGNPGNGDDPNMGNPPNMQPDKPKPNGKDDKDKDKDKCKKGNGQNQPNGQSNQDGQANQNGQANQDGATNQTAQNPQTAQGPLTAQTGSETTLCGGELTVSHQLPSYQSVGTRRAPTFIYKNSHADPQPIIFNNPTIPLGSQTPLTMSARLAIAGVDQGLEVYTDTSGLTEKADRPLRQAMQFDASALVTGSYPYSLTLTNQYFASNIGTRVGASVIVRNERDSVFGAGWTLTGLDRLHPQANGDVLVTTGDGGALVYKQPGIGTFASLQTEKMDPLISGLTQVYVRDLNQDAVPDIVSGSGGRIQTFLGNGDGTVSLHGVFVQGGSSPAHQVGDFDNDGLLDVVNFSTLGIAISYGDGLGNFVDLRTFNFPAGVVTLASAIAVGDWNEDGNLDVAFPNTAMGITFYFGQGVRGPGAFVPQTFTSVTNLGGGIAAADFNLDGHLDIVTANNFTLTLFHGDGTGNLTLALTLTTGLNQALEVTVGDWNGDGYPDVATPGIAGPNSKGVLIFENNRVGGLWQTQAIDLGLPNALNGVTHLEPGDVDNDGRLELLVSTNDASNAGAIQIFVWEDGPGFVLNRVIPAGSQARAVTTGDLDQDGQTDLVSNNGRFSDTAELFTFRNLGAEEGFLSPEGEFSTLTENPDNTFTRRLKNGTTMQFDVQGLQTSVADRNGNTTTYQYDAQDRLATITDPANLVTTFDYGGGNHLTKITDPAGRDTLFEINADGDLTKITDSDLSTREFTYDPRHRLVQQQSKRGFFTQYEYNFAGQHVKATRPDTSTREVSPGEVVGLVDPASGLGSASNPAPVVLPTEVVATLTDGKGQVSSFKTDGFGFGTVSIDALGRTTTISRNFNGAPVVTTNPNGAITRRTYDDRGNVLTVTAAEGEPEERTITFEYDPTFNLLTKIIDPAGKETTIVRNPVNGNPEQVINPALDSRIQTFTPEGLVETAQDENGELATFTYDVKGNLETILDAEGHTTRLVRDSAGNVTSLIEGEGTPEQRTRVFTYDTMNRLKSATDGTANPPTQFMYDVQGNLSTTTLPTNEQEVRTYDPMNRVASIDAPARGLTTFVYDLNGNLERTENALNDPTMFSYDMVDQLKTITDALNGVQAFTYDLEGNVETFTDARLKTTTFTYDKLNRQKSRISHGGTFTTTFTYDTRDNLIDTVDPKTQLIHRDYDDLSRLTDITTPDNAIAIGYDKVGNPTDVTDTDSQVTFTYDGLNRVATALTSQTSGLQPQVLLTNVYDAVGNRTQLDEDTGTSITNYAYDLAGRLITLTPPSGVSTQVTLGYDPSGRLANLVYPNGVTTAYGYDTKGRLDTLSHTLGANPSFASFGFTYNPVGNILALLDQVNPAETRTHTYDALQRLKTGGTMASAETYDYDLVGNRTTSFLSTTHNHDDLNRLSEDDQFSYTYDNNGNLQTKTNKVAPTEVTTYHWDAQDQLIQIDRPDTTTVTYKYDGLGRRIEKNVDGTITRFVYDGQDILLEYDGTNTFLARYSHGDQVDQPLVLQEGGTGFFYFHSNHQGSITHLTNSNGTIANSYVYDSYGRRQVVAESVIQPFSYTGREYDDESGLYFYRARYFDADTGRFLSEDPIRLNGGDQNFYRYVRNNPLNNNDPFGLQAKNPGGAVGDLFGALNEAGRQITNRRIKGDIIEAIIEAEAALESGQKKDITIEFDPQTRRIVDILPSPLIVDPGNPNLFIPVKIEGTKESDASSNNTQGKGQNNKPSC